MDIKKKIKGFPDSPGVYLMKDSSGAVIYIGKAVSLKKRVGSYFKQRPVSPRLGALISNISDIECIFTNNEAEALLLEAALIKSGHPKYNVALRDDKNYPMLKLTVNERFPRLFITRIKKTDGSRYFGPYTDSGLLRQALTFLRRIFPLRTCKKLPKAVCLNYHLKQCLGPCVVKIDEKEYRKIVNRLVLILEGRRPELLKRLQEEMGQAAASRSYEEAGRLRDEIRSLTQFAGRGQGPGTRGQLEALRVILNLKKEPKRIEAFDVSSISGKEAVGSMIVFIDGKPYKNGYRKFKIKEVRGIDDYGMMQEIVKRRYQKVIEGKLPLPDLIIIDGGRGHLSSAKEELDKIGLKDVSIMSIAKEFEHIFLPDRPDPIKLPANSLVLYLIQRIRDEAHRFAIGYHKVLRGRLVESSVLDDIKGIGPRKKAALIRQFGSVPNIRYAKIKDLINVRGINKTLALEVIRAVNNR